MKIRKALGMDSGELDWLDGIPPLRKLFKLERTDYDFTMTMNDEAMRSFVIKKSAEFVELTFKDPTPTACGKGISMYFVPHSGRYEGVIFDATWEDALGVGMDDEENIVRTCDAIIEALKKIRDKAAST